MIGKVICASMLVTSSVPLLGQDMSRSAAAGAKAVWPHMHQCTVTPGPDWFAINTKGTGTSSGRSGMNAVRGRIDLEFTVSWSPPGASAPTVSGFAINTKGTGANSGRMSSVPDRTVTVGCTDATLGGEAAAQKAAADMYLQIPQDHRATGWSCSVTGSEDAPQFVLTLLVPTILGQAERTRDSGKRSIGGREDAVLESKRTSGGHRVSIVPRGSNMTGASLVACASKDKPNLHNWDLAVAKKA